MLTDEEAPRYQPAPGVTAKELVGPRVQFPIHGDIRLYTDNHFKADSQMELKVRPDEGTLLVALEGTVEVDGHPLSAPNVAIGESVPAQCTLTLRAVRDSRLLILVFGPGKGNLRTDRA